MAQDFQIGRAGLATASGGDGLELKCSSWSQNGDVCKASGVIRGQTSVAAVNALRQQLSGYDLNTDEPVVPVTWVNDPSVDGFYRVQSVEVSEEVTGRMKASPSAGALAYRWDVELLKVPGWQAPLFEVACVGADRDSAVASPTEKSWVGLPPTTSMTHLWHLTSSSATLTANTTTGALGSANLFLYDNTTTTLYDNSVVYGVTPAAFYGTAAKIEVTEDAGTTWRSVTGRQIKNLPTAFRIGNDLIRLSHSTANVYTLETSVGGAWRTKTFKLCHTSSASNSVGTPSTITVLRNSPECCTIRIWHLPAAAANLTYVDFTVRRSAWWVEGYLSGIGIGGTGTKEFGVWRGAAEAGTAATQGIVAAADDASGDKYQIYSPMTVTSDNTNGGVSVSGSERYFPFSISIDALEPATPTTVAAYFAAMRHRQRVVAR